ncbi:MAG: hypothetical protein Q7J98_06990 [Kiritimatiellia bacterium]|nr:hypothetical protein [Kiritimatiellia bacterium]
MTAPTLRGDWTINWPAVSSPSMPHSLDEMVYASSPDIFGSSVKVDDFCARHNADGSICRQGILEFIPYGYPEDIISSHACAGDIAVYVTQKPPQFANNRDGMIAAIKQRGLHAEICYRNNQQTWNASVWSDKFKDRKISDLSDGEILNLYRLTLPSGAVAQSDAFCRSLHIWKTIYDSYSIPPGDFRWYLDPADFSSRDSLSRIAKVLLNRPAGSIPDISPVTCVQWVYTVLCLALLFPPCELILKELGMLDSYRKYWHDRCGDIVEQGTVFLAELPFKPYSPAQMIQAFLDTYCGGVDLVFFLRSGGALAQTKIEQLIQSACPENYRPLIPPYLQQLQETRDPTLQLDAAPYGFLMPSCFYCEERKPRQAQTKCWFEYVGTAMYNSILTRRI